MGSQKKKNNFSKWVICKKIPLPDLILISIYSLEQRGERCNFENILKECFHLFPKIIAFESIRKWPDARKIDRPLRRLRENGFLIKNSKKLFSLTRKGRKKISELSKGFYQKTLFNS